MRVRDLNGQAVDDEPEDIRDVRVVVDRGAATSSEMSVPPPPATTLRDVRALIEKARSVALRVPPPTTVAIGKPFKKASAVTFSESYAPSISSVLSQAMIDKYVAMQEEGVKHARAEIVDAIEDEP